MSLNDKTIVEATGWIVNQDGDVEFVADNSTSYKSTSVKQSCLK
ncbi:MAG: hypothetical protein AAF316_13685 [Cyanobacteria bacterium P01_A01_bin.80]